MSFWYFAAEHGGAAAENPTNVELMPAITTLVVFAVFFIILSIVVWPKISRGLDERQQKIRDEIAAAEQAREDARKALAEYQQNLAQSREEASRMIAQARTEAKAAAEDLRNQNQKEVAEMKQRASQEIESAKHAAITELHNQAALLATSIAGKILKREITSQDQQRLVSDAMGELAGSSRN